MAKKKQVRQRGRRGGGSVRFHRNRFYAKISIGGVKWETSFATDARGEHDTDARKAAWDWIAGVISDARRKKLGEPEPERLAPPKTLDELAAAYIHEMTRPNRTAGKPWRPGTLRHFKGHYNGAISEAFGDRIGSTITGAEIRAFLDRQLGRPLLHRYGEKKGTLNGRVVGKRTVRQYQDCLAKLFSFACTHGPDPEQPVSWLKVNPMAGMKRISVPRGEPKRWLRPPELRDVLGAIESHVRTAEHLLAAAVAGDTYVTLYTRNLLTARRNLALFTALIFSGLRAEELCQAQWNWIDFDNGLVWVKRAKVGDLRPDQRVALAPRAAAALRAWAPWKPEELRAAAGHFIFPGFARKDGPKAGPRSGTRKLTGFKKPLAQVLEHAGIEPAGVGAHAFRHTFSTLLDYAGVRPRVKQALMRHVSETMTEHYTHQEYDDQHQALELLEAQVLHAGVLRVIKNTKTGTAG